MCRLQAGGEGSEGVVAIRQRWQGGQCLPFARLGALGGDAGVVAEFAVVGGTGQDGRRLWRCAGDAEFEDVGVTAAVAAVEPVVVGLTPVEVEAVATDVVPVVALRRVLQDGFFGDGDAEACGDFSLPVGVEAVVAGVGVGKQVEGGVSGEQGFVGGGGEGGSVLQAGSDAGELRVVHAPREVMQLLVVFTALGKAVAQLVFQPALQVGKAVGSFGMARLAAFFLGGGIGGFFGFVGAFGFGCAGLLAFFEPGGDPVGRRGFLEAFGAFGVAQEQGEAVFAGEFAAGTAAFEGGFGAEVNGGLVGVFAAALAVTP